MMGSKLVCVKLLILLYVLLENYCWSEGCWEEERLALLKIKPFFNSHYNNLENWVEGDENSDCCQWVFVQCNNSTGRVTEINIGFVRNWGLPGWYLSASLFTQFQELELLDLRYNNIAGFVENEGFERLSKLSNLEVLKLGQNLFNNSILSSLNGLLSLRKLNLAMNNLNGTIDVKGFERLTFLKELDLSNNQLRGINNLNGLSKLEFLDLSGNILNRSILPSLSSISSLKTLRLREIGLQGAFNVQELNCWSNLEMLDLGNNAIDIFMVSKGLNKLEFLDLSGNILNRSILSSLNHLSSLKILYLSKIGFEGIFDVQELNFSSNLNVLDMSYNAIDKFVVRKDYKGLQKLNSLHLNGVGITDGSTLLQSMEPLPSLRKLDLMVNNFTKTVISTELQSFTNLEELILDGSSLHISLLQSIATFNSLKLLSMSRCKLDGISNFQGFHTFKSLEYLDMSDSALNTSFLQITKLMTSLKILYLSNCGLKGRLYDEDLCHLVHLQQLHIDNNDLQGNLPWCWANMLSLQILDVSSNQLTGNISLSPLKNLTSVRDLILSDNHFQIPISLGPFYNHSNLIIFYGENNQLYAEAESHSWTPKFQLYFIRLSGHLDGETFPRFFYHQHELRVIDLSHIHLIGEFPNWLLENNTNLETIYLANNSLSGNFQLPIHSHGQLMTIDVSNNFIEGHIPIEIGAFLPSLFNFNISGNELTGSIPSSFGNIEPLESLDLSSNQLSGGIPEHLATSLIALEFLVLSNNSLQGPIFPKNCDLKSMYRLQLDGNHFTGEIPECLLKSRSLVGLYLSNNSLFGRIPRWLGSMSSLEDIIMPNNHLEGSIPTEFCHLNSLRILDLSENNISGNLPSCFSPLFIKQVHLSKNMLQGQLEDSIFYNSSSLMTLDLSDNLLNGTIPSWIDRLSELRYLILSNNSFEGEVPVELCRLNQLRLVDLSHNNLWGQIPSCLDNTSLHEGYYDATPPTSNSQDLAPSPSRIPWQEKVLAGPTLGKEQNIKFTTKEVSYSYRGRPLESMFGVDFSCNKLTGQIPFQIGYLTMVRALNLSYNNLTGTIPGTFKNFKQIESLDLSYNHLFGKIPPELVELNALAVFSVAHNNLSGKTPEWTAQFATFNESSYEGNPFLCGLPLPRSCSPNGSSSSEPNASTSHEEDDNLIAVDSFYITFLTSYIVVFIGTVIIIHVNPYWIQRWFYLIETWITTHYDFVVNHLNPVRYRRENL